MDAVATQNSDQTDEKRKAKTFGYYILCEIAQESVKHFILYMSRNFSTRNTCTRTIFATAANRI